MFRCCCFVPFVLAVYYAVIKEDAERKEEEGAAKVKVDNLNENHTFVPPRVTCHLSRDESSWTKTLHNRNE